MSFHFRRPQMSFGDAGLGDARLGMLQPVVHHVAASWVRPHGSWPTDWADDLMDKSSFPLSCANLNEPYILMFVSSTKPAVWYPDS